MASIKEIRTHIKSVEQTLKITNAMYLIATSNLRKARKQLNDVRPYFEKVESTIADILYRSPEIRHRFFDKRPDIPTEQRKVGYIVVTGDKGLAGAYNHNILKLADQCRQQKRPVLVCMSWAKWAGFILQSMGFRSTESSSIRPKIPMWAVPPTWLNG